MGQRVRETERKYEAGDRHGQHAVAPDLEGLPAVAGTRTLETARLDAVYYDTADLALAAHRTTLRRRTGGDDAGWHLKLPTTEADTRTEVRVPLGRTTKPPKTLRTEVAALLRGRPLAPVVRLRTTRQRVLLLDEAGRALAEIALDEVTAEPGPTWSETEVELVRGGPELLDAVEARLEAAGLRRSRSRSKLARALGDRLAATPPAPVPPTGTPGTAGSTATAYLYAQLAAIIALDPLVRRDEPDAVHRMRVATRRARSAFKSFRRELDREATDPLGAELKWLAAVLGMERDREVLAERLDQRLAALDPKLATAAVRERLGALAADTHDDSHGSVVRILSGGRYYALLDRLEALLTAPPYRPAAAAPAPEAAAETVRRDHARLRRQIEDALALPPGHDRDTALHEARKSAKRARYASEAAEAVLGAPAAAHTARMKGVQQLLGEHQDSVLCRDALLLVSEQAHAAGERGTAYAVLVQAERDLAAAVEAALPEAWRRADRTV
ncbi:CYTH and CHAD domain-containing protein [Streptomyces sp. NPDC051976]|uniref:CYTH and CHAD domain-containing protein n=1 Tax=Streptomyces sp. NPDC051976 TaxID=3154947 RepID=UPI003431FEC2